MVYFLPLLTALFPLGSALASPLAARTMHVHERRDSAPSGYVKDGPAPADHVLGLRLALTPSDFKSLEDELYAVSTPGNPDYGKHLSKEQVMHSVF
ncbi:hypothetical protein EVG20_g11236 [Dentipellis fragilis]|uniref:Peptidase S53 activation domain-containing protein n=1 Tax=Dentipellis fragilis TaxID=205917 RepID=A0A4Y9XL17_9AGAM|nr:hypothetical protein EVG20_g11236 [Dentipellis fragilis]